MIQQDDTTCHYPTNVSTILHLLSFCYNSMNMVPLISHKHFKMMSSLVIIPQLFQYSTHLVRVYCKIVSANDSAHLSWAKMSQQDDSCCHYVWILSIWRNLSLSYNWTKFMNKLNWLRRLIIIFIFYIYLCLCTCLADLHDFLLFKKKTKRNNYIGKTVREIWKNLNAYVSSSNLLKNIQPKIIFCNFRRKSRNKKNSMCFFFLSKYFFCFLIWDYPFHSFFVLIFFWCRHESGQHSL